MSVTAQFLAHASCARVQEQKLCSRHYQCSAGENEWELHQNDKPRAIQGFITIISVIEVSFLLGTVQ